MCLLGCGRVAFDARDDANAMLGDGDNPGDGALDVTACDDGLPGVVFCEDFEGTPQLPGAEAQAPSFVTPDTTNPYRGARSLHSRVTRTNEQSWLVGSPLANLTSGELYARWYLFVPGAPQSIDIASVHIIEQVAPFDGFHLGINGGGIYAINRNMTGSGVQPIAFPRDRWVCIQVRIVIAATNGSIETWIDEAVGPTTLNADTSPAAGFRNLHAGIYSAVPNTVPLDVWTDEVALGTMPIPCD